MRDVSRLDMKLLRAFCALMEERSVTQAARRMELTQQGLSSSLQRMREIFEDPLFVREARGVSPTPHAEALYPRIRHALTSLEKIFERDEFFPASASGIVRVAASDYSLSVIITPLLKNFRELAPNIRLAMIPFDLNALGEQLRSGVADLALTSPHVAPSNLYTRRIHEDRYLCAVRADHPLSKGDVDIDAFCSFEHLIVSPEKGGFFGPTDAALERINRTRKIVLVLQSFSVAGAVLERTDLIAVLPERLLREMKERLYVFPHPLDIKAFELVSVWSERVHQDPLQSWFRQLCHNQAEGRGLEAA